MKWILSLYLILANFCLATIAWGEVMKPDFMPVEMGQQVVINIPQLKLFIYENGQVVASYDIAIGKNKTRTPLGDFVIGDKLYQPTWHVPKSIQREMEAEGKPVIIQVPPGPENPLGPVFVRMGDPKLGLGIHGTNNPNSVPGVRSHGCVRMRSRYALDFAKKVESGTMVSVIYQQAILNVDEMNHLWLSVFKDVYHQHLLDERALLAAIQSWSRQQGLQLQYDEKQLHHIVRAQRGRPICLTCALRTDKIAGKLQPLHWISNPYLDESVSFKFRDSNKVSDYNRTYQFPQHGLDNIDKSQVEIVNTVGEILLQGEQKLEPINLFPANQLPLDVEKYMH